jgi:hypothetical protein
MENNKDPRPKIYPEYIKKTNSILYYKTFKIWDFILLYYKTFKIWVIILGLIGWILFLIEYYS